MTSYELILKMKEELKDYQIGLHNIGLNKYMNMLSDRNPRRSLYEITGAKICEKSIAEHIMQTGLNVSDTIRGLRSTVTFIGDLYENSLDYSYNNYSIGKVWNIIIGVPELIYYEDESYSLGNLRSDKNVGNVLFLNPNLASQFVYGYYGRDIVSVIEKDIGLGINMIDTVNYSSDLEFYSNPNFYGYLADSERVEFLRKVFNADRRLFSILKLANSDSSIGLLFCTPLEKFVVTETRRQIKRLAFERKS